jgi:uncharacterized membrane protein
MDLNLSHLHLLLNHFPTIGTIVGLGLFFTGLIGKSSDLKRASLAVFLMIALIAIPTYATGNAAMQRLTGEPGVSEDLMEAHQAVALLALIIMEFTGLAAWFGLWQFRRVGRFARWTIPAVLILSILTVGLMGQAANIGGEIRHPEIRLTEEGTPNSGPDWLKGSFLKKFILDRTWLWAAGETLHFMGLALLFGIVLLLDLRLLGFIRSVSFTALHQLLPWAVLGFAVNAATGMMFFVAAYDQYTTNAVFHWKLVLILLACVNALYFTVVEEPWMIEPGADAPLRAKAVAVSAVLLWIGVIYCGRMLPFIGNAF